MKKSVLVVLSLCLTLVFAVSTKAFAGDAAKGEAMYKAKCKACHKLDEKALVGPGLKGAYGRHTEPWLKKWITNAQGTWEENDAETQKLKEWKPGKDKAPKTSMVVKPAPTPEEADDAIAYLKTLQ
jgi:cytochrome c2